MSTVYGFQTEQVMQWRWPLDLTAYDRTSDLSGQEHAMIDTLCAKWTRAERPRVKEIQAALPRLINPVADALKALDIPEAAHITVLRVFLQVMHDHQAAFWDLSPEAWLTIFNSSLRRYNIPGREALTHRALVATVYVLQGFTVFEQINHFELWSFAARLFGQASVDEALQIVLNELLQSGYRGDYARSALHVVLAKVLLAQRSPRLTDITLERLEVLYQISRAKQHKKALSRLSSALVRLNVIQRPVATIPRNPEADMKQYEGIAADWIRWCRKWQSTSTFTPKTRSDIYHSLLKVGRWLAEKHPDITVPHQWTRELAADYVAAVDRMRVGDWCAQVRSNALGKPLSAHSKAHYINSIRAFFLDCQTWNWIPRHFDPRVCFATPRPILALTEPNPRVISGDIWAKLLWAGLNLTEQDLPMIGTAYGRSSMPVYPLEMVRALALTWLFCGLRNNELRRLRIGCIHWERDNQTIDEPDRGRVTANGVCLLNVPVHKTGKAFTKPVDAVVGEAINLWEKVRPASTEALDPKTGEKVHYLFFYRGKQPGNAYINDTLIPILCRKAGVPREDTRGNITSHRARSTIASQLANAKEPMTLHELQAWLGHQTPDATRYYVQITPTRQAQALAKAGYMQRNLRMVDILIDQDAIRNGQACDGAPWRFYDLGHGYCTYDFFDQCPHRMACAKCAFYRPKDSSQIQVLEAKRNLQHMRQAIPLKDEEIAAIEDGLAALEKLRVQLTDVPTPEGLTPRQLGANPGGATAFIPFDTIR